MNSAIDPFERLSWIGFGEFVCLTSLRGSIFLAERGGGAR